MFASLNPDLAESILNDVQAEIHTFCNPPCDVCGRQRTPSIGLRPLLFSFRVNFTLVLALLATGVCIFIADPFPHFLHGYFADNSHVAQTNSTLTITL